MRNYCYELGKTLYSQVNPKTELRFAERISSVNDMRGALAGLKGLDKETLGEASKIIDQLEREPSKARFRHLDDIKRNLAKVMTLLKKVEGEDVSLEEVVLS